MKALELWARKFAGAEKHSVDMAVVDAYKEGFKKALDHAAKMMAEIYPISPRNNRGQQLGILIRAIGSAEVDPVTGERLSDKEDREDASRNR